MGSVGIVGEKRTVRQILRYASHTRSICTKESETLDLHESEKQTSDGADADNGPASDLDLLVGDALAKVPHEMPEAVEAVECEGQADEELGQDLCGNRPCAKGGGQAGALEMPAKDGGGEVRQAEDVERAGEGDSSNTVEGRQIPGDLCLVDTQVRGDGAVQSLFGKNLVGSVTVGHDLRGGEPVSSCEPLTPIRRRRRRRRLECRPCVSLPALVHDAGRCNHAGLARDGHCSLLLAHCLLYCEPNVLSDLLPWRNDWRAIL